jgi:hypothetical protein
MGILVLLVDTWKGLGLAFTPSLQLFMIGGFSTLPHYRQIVQPHNDFT